LDQNFRFLRSETTQFTQQSHVPVRMRASDKNLTLDNWEPDNNAFMGGMTRVWVEQIWPDGKTEMISWQWVDEDEETSIFTDAARAAKKAAIVVGRTLLAPVALAADLASFAGFSEINYDAGKKQLKNIDTAGKRNFLQLPDAKDMPVDLVIRHFPLPLKGNPKNEVMIAISGKNAVKNRLIAEMTIGSAQFISYATDKKGASDQKKKCRASRSCMLWEVFKENK